jgi:hypothetical protein
MKTLLHKALTFVLFLFSVSFFAQTIFGQDSIPVKKNLKNTIRINLTNPMIFGTGCYMFGYERTIGYHQSFSVNTGRFSLPRLVSISTDSIKDITKDDKSSGFHLSGDYRFYLAKENKYNSPHGLYIGPYATYNSFSREYKLASNIESFTGELYADMSFRAATIGFQLGYQFIFWKRVTLDMILFGPGVGSYKLKMDLSTNLDPDQEAELFQKINDAIKDKIPGYSLVINSGTFESSGSYNTSGVGFRYVVMLGFRF